MIVIVVQFGLATMPRGMSASSSGLTSETTSGTSSLHPEGARVVDDDGARGRELRRPLTGDRPARREDRDVEAADGVVGQADHGAPVRSRTRPAERSEANGDDLRGGEAPRVEQREHLRAHRAGGADDRDTRRHANSPNGCSGRIVSGPESSKALCRARTASGTLLDRHDAGDADRRRRDHLDVDALLAEGREDLRGHARVRLHARADDRDLPHAVVGEHLDAVLLARSRRARPARRRPRPSGS